MKWRFVSSISAVVLLHLLLLPLFLILGVSQGFFIGGSVNIVLIFVVLLWSFIRFNYVSDSTFISKAEIFSAAAAVILTGLVSFSCYTNCGTTFRVGFSVDVLLLLGFGSWELARKLMAVRMKRLATAGGDGEEEGVQLEQYSFLLKEVAALPRGFSYGELKAATGNFQTHIAKGGSGSVFKGVLGDGMTVAVKRIDGEVRGEREFRTELTAVLSAQHVNLVRILGYCLVPRLLVYEFYPNGSLDSWIFLPPGTPGSEGGGGRSTLSWALRYHIAIDVARALAYLHHDCRVRILHLDVKPENILLGENFQARVSDFGISRMMNEDESKVVTTVRGTRGYWAPEWFLGVGISEKSDVYSFGMVLLELIGGRRNAVFYTDEGEDGGLRWSYFPKDVSEKMREGKLMEAVDERMLQNIDEEEVRRVAYVALWCIQEKPELRPTMAATLNMLQGLVQVAMPPKTKMFMVDFLQSSVVAGTQRSSSGMASSSSSSSHGNGGVDLGVDVTFSSPGSIQ